MVKPSSFSTICTANCAFECIGLLLSLSLFHTGETIYIMCDTGTKRAIDEMTPRPRLDMVFLVELDEYSGYDRMQMVARNLWSKFQMTKSRVISRALETSSDTLLLDSDMIITGVIDDVDDTKDIGVSPQFIRKEFVDKTGFYNGGMVWTKNKDVPIDWICFTETSRYYDQASIEDLARKYSHFEFGEHYNVQCWRLTLSDEPPDVIASHFTNHDSLFLYKNLPVKMLHTHFLDARFEEFNKIVLQHLVACKNYRILAIIYRVINNKWVLTIPKQPMTGMAYHKNDSYRELPLLMKLKNPDVDIQFSDATMHCWIEPNILTYDRPTLEWVNDEVSRASLVLLGNGDVNVEGKHPCFDKVKPWIFWPRKPMLLEKIMKRHGKQHYDERTVESIFIGNYENSVQERFRKAGANWEDVITEFHCTAGCEHRFTHEEYLMKLRDAKYGLCLRGYGSKCHREVELMAFGTIPIVTPGVTVDSFMEPLVENIHYIKVNGPSELRDKLTAITETQWTEMSDAGYEWYIRNVYSTNCWNTTITRILYE